MITSSNRIVRMWRTILPSRGSVARPSDRFQSGLLVLFVLVALAAVPFAASLGSETYARQQVQSAQQLKERTPAKAVLLADGPPLSSSSRTALTGNTRPTDATWQLADATRRTGKVDAEQGAVKGSTVPIWVDRVGNPVGQPLTPAAAAIDAFGVGISLWVATLLLLVLLYRITGFVLDRLRYAQWQHEWFHVLDPQARS